jgi:hypothetical protein
MHKSTAAENLWVMNAVTKKKFLFELDLAYGSNFGHSLGISIFPRSIQWLTPAMTQLGTANRISWRLGDFA